MQRVEIPRLDQELLRGGLFSLQTFFEAAEKSWLRFGEARISVFLLDGITADELRASGNATILKNYRQYRKVIVRDILIAGWQIQPTGAYPHFDLIKKELPSDSLYTELDLIFSEPKFFGGTE